jgi:N-acetylmuramoyl-L-alanine amidase
VIERPSPNHDARRPGTLVDILLLHYTGMPTAAEALDRLCDPAAKVSAHYTIDEDGTVYAHVPEHRRAWHAGVASWAGERDVNARSIGIELVNPGHEFGYRPFPEPQMAALIELARGILARHPIPPARVLGHSDVAPARKTDPGELFDWPRLAGAGIGLWPASAPPEAGRSVREVRDLLARFGYGIEPGDTLEEAARSVVIAFQRHFRPARIDGEPDPETVGRLAWLAERAAQSTASASIG